MSPIIARPRAVVAGLFGGRHRGFRSRISTAVLAPR